MRDDGGVWGILHELVQQRGASSSRCTKAKGHATAQMVHHGRVRLQDIRGNSCADETMHWCFRSCSNRRRALAELYEERAKMYLLPAYSGACSLFWR